MKGSILFFVCIFSLNVFAESSQNSTQSSFSYYKNKITRTVKADLGFTDELFTGDETQSEQLLKEIACATRMCIYSVVIDSVVLPTLFSLIPGKFQLQFNEANRPSLFDVAIKAPLWEECIFTGMGVGSSEKSEFYKYHKWIVPVLFGLAHRHKDPKTYLLLASSAALTSFMHINHANAYWLGRKRVFSKVPWLHHMFHNLIAYCLMHRKWAADK